MIGEFIHFINGSDVLAHVSEFLTALNELVYVFRPFSRTSMIADAKSDGAGVATTLPSPPNDTID